ncbi:MAG: transposase [Deltaproteobacteria bacterium]|nr:transposase [Deltaproteobacteria bacterium]MCB9487112.1 transposase [Deltaproteobacteria bacterium]
MRRTLPAGYFITFSCYGARLHGHEEFSIDRHHRAFRQPPRPTEIELETYERNLMHGMPFLLGKAERDIVLKSIVETCRFRGWQLFAVHVRTNHVHLVAASENPPEKMMADCKAYATRALHQAGVDRDRKKWTRHGSTHYLWDAKAIDMAVSYVLAVQGEPMAVYDGREE